MANDDPWGNDTAAADPWGSGGGATEDGDTDINSNTKGGADDPRGPMKCFNCQEEGHASKDCTKAETCR